MRRFSSLFLLSFFPFFPFLYYPLLLPPAKKDNARSQKRNGEVNMFFPFFYLSFEKGDAKEAERGNGRGPLSPSLSIWVSLVFSLSSFPFFRLFCFIK